MLTADHVAIAVVTAARRLQIPAVEVVNPPNRKGCSGDHWNAICRARAYAAIALDRVFLGQVSRMSIARMVGAGKSASGYFSSLDQRRADGDLNWWLPAVAEEVAAAIRSLPMGEPRQAPPAPPRKIGRLVEGAAPPLKAMPYRPPAGTYEQALADDAEDDVPIFDRGKFGGDRKPREYGRISRAQADADLRAALENTARMTPQED